MTDLDEHGRPEPPPAGDETETLLGFLEFQRATLAWKCSGLDADGLRATTAASSMTLGGMLKHLAYVEDQWFSRWLRGRDPAPPWDTVDWEADRDVWKKRKAKPFLETKSGAALAWLISFGVWAARYAPMYLSPRVDARA